MAPARAPSGNSNASSAGAPASPGFCQYVCHPGASRSRSPNRKARPGATAPESDTSDAVARSLRAAALSAAHAGAAAAADTAHSSAAKTGPRRGIHPPEAVRVASLYRDVAPGRHLRPRVRGPNRERV